MVTTADTPNAFQREVLDADVPVLVDFWAPWCGPCRMVSPEVEAIAAEYGGRVKVVKVNVDENPQVAGRYDVRGIPTIGLFSKGALVKQVVGARPRHAIVSELGLNFWAPKAPPARPADERRPAGAPRRPDGRY